MATTEIPMTVTQASPLMVIADGADTACPAAVTDAAVYAVDDRVQATLRTPQKPLVTGKVETDVPA